MKKLISIFLFGSAICCAQVARSGNTVSAQTNPGGGGGSGPYSPSSFTSNNVLWGNGAGAIQSAAPGGSLISDNGSGQLTLASLAGQNIILGTGAASGLSGGLFAKGRSANGVFVGSLVGGGGYIQSQTAASAGAPTFLSMNQGGGNVLIGTATDNSNGVLQLASSTSTTAGISQGTSWTMYSPSAGAVAITGGDIEEVGGTPTTTGLATSNASLVKTVGSIANNSGTSVLTITVPNGAHSASVHIVLTGALGTGGAIGADEATQTISYDIGVTRTTGVNAVAVISTAYGSSGSVSVAGATTIAVTAALGSVSGAVGATNTFAVNVTIARGGGSSTNHTCLVHAEVLNANASGVTIN